MRRANRRTHIDVAAAYHMIEIGKSMRAQREAQSSADGAEQERVEDAGLDERDMAQELGERQR